MSKYIECLHATLVRCKLEDGSSIEFYPFVMNKYTGQPEHSGFTEVTEEQLKDLEKSSRVFRAFVKQKLLVPRDNLPSSAQTPSSVIAAKDKQIADLQAELAKVKAAAEGKVTQADLDAEKEKQKALEQELLDAKAKIAEYEITMRSDPATGKKK